MAQDELNVEFFVCKENLDHLAKHGHIIASSFLNVGWHRQRQQVTRAMQPRLQVSFIRKPAESDGSGSID